MEAMIDRDGCIGCELCVNICPEVFEMGDDGKATVIGEMIPAKSESCAAEAEVSCPVNVITIE